MKYGDDDQLREASLHEAADLVDFPLRVPAQLSSGWELVTGNLWFGDDDRWAYAMHLRDPSGQQEFSVAQCAASAWSLADWHHRRGEAHEAAVAGYETVHVRPRTNSWPQLQVLGVRDGVHITVNSLSLSEDAALNVLATMQLA